MLSIVPCVVGTGHTTVLIARGSTAKPTFERVPLPHDTTSHPAVITLEPSAGGPLLPASTSKQATAIVTPDVSESSGQRGKGSSGGSKRGQHDVTMLGAENEGEVVRRGVAAVAADTYSSRKRQEPESGDVAAEGDEAVAADGLMGPSGNGMDTGGLDSDLEDANAEHEQTLGERLAALELQHQQRGIHHPGDNQQPGTTAAMDDDQATAGGLATAAAGSGQLPPGPIKADSLSVLLTQALRSSDRALLERCLGVSNERVIVNTVKRLVPMDAVALLRVTVERLQSKPVRGHQLATWIRAVLVSHTAYLMAAPGAQPIMTSLYQVRVAFHCIMQFTVAM